MTITKNKEPKMYFFGLFPPFIAGFNLGIAFSGFVFMLLLILSKLFK